MTAPSVDAVYAALDRERQGGSIDLPVAVTREPDLAALGAALVLLRLPDAPPPPPPPTPSGWPVAVTTLTRTARSVQLTGTARYGAPGGMTFDVGVTLGYATGDDGGVFELRLANPDGWTFGHAFPVLPESPVQENGLVSFLPSFLAALPVTNTAYVATTTTGGAAALRLVGLVHDGSSLFRPFADFYGPFPLRFDGPVRFRAAGEAPELSLFARSTRAPMTLGPVTLAEFGLRLATELELDPETSPVSEYSTVFGEATLTIGGTHPVTGVVSVPLLAMAHVWLMMVTFDEADAPRLGQGLAGIAGLLGVPDEWMAAPRAFDDFTGFHISDVDLAIVPPAATTAPALEYVAVVLRSTNRWTPPVPYLVVSDVGMRWLAMWSGGSPVIAGTVFGTIEVGQADLDRRAALAAGAPRLPAPATAEAPLFSLDIEASFPQFVVTGSLAEGEIPLDQALGWLLGVRFPVELHVTDLEIEADLRAQTFTGTAIVTTDFSLTIGDAVVDLTDVFLRVDARQSGVTGGLVATFGLPGVGPAGATGASFYLGAEYAGATEGWVFTGGLGAGDEVDLVTLVRKFMSQAADDSLPAVTLSELTLRFATRPGTYHVKGAVVGTWRPVILGSPRDLSLGARVEIERDAAAAVRGSVVGTFRVNKLEVSAGVNFAARELTYLLKVRFGDLWVSAVTSTRGADKHQVITIRLGGVTLGEVVEYLVGLAAPTVKVTLDPPWDLLYRVDLSSFALTVDPTESWVAFTYSTDVNLGVMAADSVGVCWQREPDGRSTIRLILTGRFLDRLYSPEKPLSWDVLGGAPPAVPGQGSSLFDLQFLGLGQRVTLNTAYPATVRETVAKLDEVMKEVPPDKNPLPLPGLEFAPDSEWLIGFQASFLGTLDLSFLFNDPRLYGLSVGLRGERAGSLAGLTFEILYKKISDDLGMFRVELRLPDAFRRIQLGAVSVTVGIAVVEVYTNGNFLVDLGFPHNRDFSRSFTVEVLPFLGRGGIYFGVLNGTTSSRVPRISNGTFAPVLELGIGLAVGVGKEVSAGPLSGGAYVQVIGIFQGVLGWFNPSSNGVAPATYYWVQAVVGIQGKVYGRVDFAVLQVSVTIEAWAEVTVALTAYRAAVFRLNIGVRVTASIKILFVTIPFSFRATLDMGFAVGTDQPTPWVVTGGQSTPGRERLRGNVLPAARDPRRIAALLAATHLAAHADGISWDPALHVFPNGRQTAELVLLPAFSIGNLTAGWGTMPPAPAVPEYRAALLLLAPLDQPFGASLVVEAFLRWCVAAVTGSPAATVTAGQLDLLAAALADPGQTAAPFSVDSLATFFATNLCLDVTGRPAGADPDALDAMVVAMPPFLAWTSPQVKGRDLATYERVGALYQWGAAAYAARLAADPPPATPVPPDPLDAYRSFASYVFRDWCLGVARAAVREAVMRLADWTVPLPEPPAPALSLAAVANEFLVLTVEYAVRAGDTLDSVAEVLGTTGADLLFFNPALRDVLAAAAVGTELEVRLGVTPESVALANATVPLSSATPVPLGTLEHQVASGETLTAIAARFGLAGAAALFSGTGLADDPALLRGGATLAVPAFVLTQGAFPTAVAAAAAMFPHYVPGTDPPDLDWYLQAVATLNPGWTGDTPLAVPREFGVLSGPATYVPLPGDTVRSVAAALALAQRAGTGTGGPHGWAAFRDAVAAAPGGWMIPAASTVVQPRETVTALTTRLVGYTTSTGIALVADADLLAPLAVVAVPGVTVTLAAGLDTLAAIAARYDLGVAGVAERVADVPLFARSEAADVLHVRDVPAMPLDVLVGAVAGGEGAARVAGQVSRTLLSGQRLPAPEDTEDGHRAATGPPVPLPDLTGQQFDSPAPNPAEPDAVGLRVVVTSATEWIVLRDSLTDAGAIVRTDAVTELALEFTNDDLARRYPPPTMRVDAVVPPAPLPLGEPSPVTYGLDHRVPLQSPVPLPVPGYDAAATGSASLWPFPAALLARAADAPATRYDVVRTNAPGLLPEPGDVVADSTFATAVTFGIRRVGALEHVYELTGVDTADRNVLLALWAHLSEGAAATAYLAVAPPPDAPSTAGLALLATDDAATFVLKTNQSTETKPPAADDDDDDDDVEQPYAAALSDVADFLVLLWQGSVVGGTGYYVGFRTVTGDDLPLGAFDPNGAARLSLLVVLTDRAAPAPGGRALLPFDTCALVAPGLDPAASALYVEAADGSETTTVAVVPQGLTGFTTTLPRPPGDDTPAARVARLFSLLTWSAPPPVGACGLPVAPQDGDGTGRTAWQRDREARAIRAGRLAAPLAEPDHWAYQQVLPFARTGPASPAPAVPGLPSPPADPYRAVSAEPVPITLGFADVLGNVAGSTGDGTPWLVDAPTGYTDALLPPGQWPALSMSYTVAPGADGPVLTVDVTPQPGATAPQPGESPGPAIDAARRQAERYAAAYYQLAAGRVDAALVTTLAPAALAVDAVPLWRYVAAGHLAATAAGSVLPVTVSGTVADLRATYGVSAAGLAAANDGRPAAVLFGGVAPAVPAYLVAAAGVSADDLVATLPPGWPPVASGAALLARPENAGLPLRPGTTLALGKPRAVISPEHEGTLADVAGAAHTLPGLLALDNADVPAIRAGFALHFDGVRIDGPATPYSFAAAAREFVNEGHQVDAATLAAANADASGLLDPTAPLTTAHYVAGAGDSLAANQSGATAAALAAANGGTDDLYDAGALLHAGDFADVTVLAGETLREFADRYACPPALLLAANPGLALTDATLPGCVTIPDTVLVPYTVRPGDTLDGIAALFGDTALALATRNAAMPGTLAAGRVVTVEGPAGPLSTPTVAGDSFTAVYDRLTAQGAVTFDAVVSAVAGVAGYLDTGALLVCPPAVLPGKAPLSPRAAATAYGLDPVAFAQANAGVVGLVTPGVTLTAGGVTVTTGSHDSIATVATRFATEGTAPTLADLVTALADVPFLRARATALLPPAPVRVTAPLPTTTPPEQTTVPFPLTVALRLTRPDALVDAAFRGGPAESAETAVPPHTEASDDTGDLTLAAFEASFRAAYRDLRLATGRASSAGPDLWVVAFTDGGISEVTVAPGLTWEGKRMPRTFALRPLDNALVNRSGVGVHLLEKDGRLAPVPTPTDFAGVDAEVWARRFLSDVDLFLTAGYAAAAHADPAAAGAVGRVVDAKRILAGAVARGVWPVLDMPDPDPDADAARAAAVARFSDELAVSLSRGYAATALVQYDATVVPPENTVGGRPARLYGTVATPRDAPYSLAAAKTSLTEGRSFVGFLLDVTDPQWRRSVDLQLDYGFLDLEYDIRPEPRIGGYEASRWAAFYPPLTGEAKPAALHTDLGTATVPVPLRAYPAAPVLLGQSAAPTATPPVDLATAPLWTYALTYAHEHAEQDEVLVTASFNVVPPLSDAVLGDDDVIAALARYATVAEPLWTLLSGYATGTGDPVARANAATTFADLACLVAAAWDTRWGPAPKPDPPVPLVAADGPEPEAYTLGVNVEYDAGSGRTHLAAVVLDPAGASPGPGGAWPEVAYVHADGTAVPLPADPPADGTRRYRFESPVAATDWPRLRLSWPGLHVMAYQNARASIAVQRNARLLDDGPPTDLAFVFSTPPAVAPDIATPLNTWDRSLDITALGPLPEALTEVFTALRGSAAVPGAVGVSYGFEVVPSNGDNQPGLVSWLPIALAHLTVDGTTGTEVADVATSWRRENDLPPGRVRMFGFSVTLFSQLATGTPQPLLSIPNLVHVIAP